MAKVVSRMQSRMESWIARMRRQSFPSVASQADESTVVHAMAVMDGGPDQEALKAIFRQAGWQLTIAGSLTAALQSQQRGAAPVVLYQRQLPGLDWRAAVSTLARRSPRPSVLLLSRSADQNLFDELVRCGGFDLLRLPLDPNAVRRTIGAGWAISRAHSVRNHEITPLRTA